MAEVMEAEDVVEMVDNSRFLHGRIDPGSEESLSLVKAIGLPESGKQEVLCDGSKGDLSDQPTEPSLGIFTTPKSILIGHLLNIH